LLYAFIGRFCTFYYTIHNPTMNMNPGDLARLPIPEFPDDTEETEQLIKDNVRICKDEWDSFETSYDFRKHPLI
uniref:hypothetical protein n=1 Tax=Ruminococcus flavefaciens TaxID=1265 RepID=UPI0026EF9659